MVARESDRPCKKKTNSDSPPQKIKPGWEEGLTKNLIKIRSALTPILLLGVL